MAKVLNSYTLNTGINIKNRSSGIGDESATTSTVSVTNITTTDIRNAIGESMNAVKALHDSANVNQWSNFGPFAHAIANGNELYFSRKDPAAMGNFAGYNHSAITPYAEVISVEPTDVIVFPGQEVSIHVNTKMHLGELDYKSMAAGGTTQVLLSGAAYCSATGDASISDYSTEFSNSSGDDVNGDMPQITNGVLVAGDFDGVLAKIKAYGKVSGPNGYGTVYAGPAFTTSITIAGLHVVDKGVSPNDCNVSGNVVNGRAYFKKVSGVDKLHVSIDGLASMGTAFGDCSDPDVLGTVTSGLYTGKAYIRIAVYQDKDDANEVVPRVNSACIEGIVDGAVSTAVEVNTGAGLNDLGADNEIQIMIRVDTTPPCPCL